MNILAIDTSTSYAGIALRFRGESLMRVWRSAHNHGRELMPRILGLTQLGGCSVSDLDCVAVALGPGGFSAVRVGVSCALGLASPRGIRMVGIPTHYLQAYTYAAWYADDSAATSAVSLIPIGRHQMSAAEYAMPIGDIDATSRIEIVTNDEIASRSERGSKVVCGEGQLTIDDTPGFETDLDPRPPELMLDIVDEAVQRGLDSHWPIHPIYAREPTITRPRPDGQVTSHVQKR